MTQTIVEMDIVDVAMNHPDRVKVFNEFLSEMQTRFEIPEHVYKKVKNDFFHDLDLDNHLNELRCPLCDKTIDLPPQLQKHVSDTTLIICKECKQSPDFINRMEKFMEGYQRKAGHPVKLRD